MRVMDNILLNLLPSIATVFLTIAYLPQIIHTFKTKKVDGISLNFWLILNVALILMLTNAIVIFIKFGTWGYMVTEILNEGLAFVMLIMVLKYKDNKDAVS